MNCVVKACYLATLLACCDASGTLFVNYIYQHSFSFSQSNFVFYLRHGMRKSGSIDYGLLLLGDCASSECLAPTDYVPAEVGKKILILRRNGTASDGYVGDHTVMLDYLAYQNRSYDYYILLDSTAAGPIVPSFLPKSWHWSRAFIDKMNDRVGLVTTSIRCDRKNGPKVAKSAFAISKRALDALKASAAAKPKHKDRAHLLTKTIISNSIGLDALALAHRGVDWLNQSSSGRHMICRSNSGSLRDDPYRGISINPLEVVFYAGKRQIRISYMVTDVDKYLQWHDQRYARENSP